MLGVEGVRARAGALRQGQGHDRRAGALGPGKPDPDQNKLDALGFAGVMRPICTCCADHMGSTWARVQTWDGKKWNVHLRLVQADEQIIKPLVKATADKYAGRQEADAPHRRRTASPDGMSRLARRQRRARGLRLLREPPGRKALRAVLSTWHRRLTRETPMEHQKHRSQRQRHRGHLQPRDPGAQGRFAAGARRQDRGHPGRQRRGQDHDAARHLQPAARASAARSPRARSSCAASASKTSRRPIWCSAAWCR